MNHYSQLLSYIKGLADADNLINTVTHSEPDKIDWNKSNIFPLLNIAVTGASFTNGQTIIFNVELACLNVREKVAEINTDKVFGNDNEVDNMNETLAILNRIWKIMYKDFNEVDFRASENPTLQPLFEERTNLLDGWVLSFDLEMPNTTISLCP